MVDGQLYLKQAPFRLVLVTSNAVRRSLAGMIRLFRSQDPDMRLGPVFEARINRAVTVRNLSRGAWQELRGGTVVQRFKP